MNNFSDKYSNTQGQGLYNIVSSPDEFVAIRNFMLADAGLGLKPNEAMVYAMIYQFSTDGAGCYFGGIDYISRRLNIPRRTVFRVIDSLVQRGLIVEQGNHKKGDNKNTKRYMAVISVADEARKSYLSFWTDTEAVADKDLSSDPESQSDTTSSGANLAPERSEANTCSSAKMAPETKSDASSGAKMALDQVPKWHPKRHIYKNKYNSSSNKNNYENPPISPNLPYLQIDIPLQPSALGEVEGDGGVFGEKRMRALTGEEQNLLERIKSQTLNKNGNDYCFTPFVALLDEGFQLSEIESAWHERLADCDHRQLPAERYPNVANWLRDENRFSARSLIRKARVAASHKRIEQETEATEEELFEQLQGMPEADALKDALAEAVAQVRHSFSRAMVWARGSPERSAESYPDYSLAQNRLKELLENRHRLLLEAGLLEIKT